MGWGWTSATPCFSTPPAAGLCAHAPRPPYCTSCSSPCRSSPCCSTCLSSSPSPTTASCTRPPTWCCCPWPCSDLLIGLIVIPFHSLYFITSCWLLGQFMCPMMFALSFVLTSASVGSILLISVDRYVAICQPLRYNSEVTMLRVQLAVCLCWACAILYNCGLLWETLREPGRHTSCHGECGVEVGMVSGAVDLLVTFLGPVFVVVVLYLRVFAAVLSQVRQMRSSRVAGMAARRSELKAAGTLGVVVVVFLVCFCPYFYPSFAGQDMSDNVAAGSWLLYSNSCLNPLMYASFYPWFRKAIKLIVTLQILQPDSCQTTIF
ncbi:hypothetical protein NHX12_015953 [Muraenolepis orangiensis]|uniref:G-protein coupled receptors family 1 profile domain-containing protein n=1 Tax=Muraenolepis orangiensis TaxID=630683 RepID=A0A9Q0D574_9TELE|nr:hypothetical protein NHX12_015953 [Muraenolepis orangiensis]